MTASTQSTVFLNRFSTLDFAYLCPERGLVGESLYLSAFVTGTLDEQGFVMDFSRLKKILKSQADLLLDHRLALPLKANTLKEFWETDLSFELEFTAGNGTLRYAGPEQALAKLDAERINREAVEDFLGSAILPFLGENILSLKIIAEKDPRFTAEANYRYTHGLRLHEGNCQRLAHGHRNPIEVHKNGERRADKEAYLADLFADAHFTAARNVRNLPELDLPLEQRQKNHPGTAELAYNSSQGDFHLKIPASQLIVLKDEPSIEHIAAFAQKALEREFRERFEVRAYEGLNKGAVTGE